jgi:hypothetical protein
VATTYLTNENNELYIKSIIAPFIKMPKQGIIGPRVAVKKSSDFISVT